MPSVLDPALQSVGNRASLPALKPTGQSAADSPKGSRQVLAHISSHFQPFIQTLNVSSRTELTFFFQNSCRPRKTSFRSATNVRWTSVPNALEQRSAAATVSRRIAFHQGWRIVRSSTRSVRQLSLPHTLTFSRATPSQILSTTYV